MPKLIVKGFRASEGGITFTYDSQNSNFTAQNNYVYGVDTTAGAITATLPASAPASSIIFFTDEVGNFGTNALTIVPSGADTIIGDTSWTLNSNYELVAVVKGEGADWLLLGAQTSNVSGSAVVINQGGGTPTSPTAIVNGTTTLEIPSSNGDVVLEIEGIPHGVFGFYTDRANSNIALGSNAYLSATAGANNYSNVALGTSTLRNNAGFRNIAIGQDAMYDNTSGVDNIAIGSYALSNSTTGQLNIALGNSALFTATTAVRNIAIGENTLKSVVSGGYNIAIGDNSLLNSVAFDNLAIGYSSLLDNTSGTNNIALGYSALENNTTGSTNTALGQFSLFSNLVGQRNTGVGYDALSSCRGDNNVGLGHSAGNSITTGSNNIIIGYNADASAITVSNEITLGNSSITSLRCAVTSITSLSDQRDKKNIQDLPLGLDFLSTLRPVTFVWDTRDGSKKDIPAAGFIAQELQQAEEGIDYLNLVSDSNPDRLEATQGNLIPVLVKAIQDLKGIVEAQTAEIAELKARLA